MINYWWVTRPKRKLNGVPQTLAVFAAQSLDQVWDGQRTTHLSLEEALEKSGLKRTGDRRDQTGGGGRTYKAWLISLGLIFNQTNTNQIKLTLAGEALMSGEPPVKILTDQVLKYQFPSSYSLGRGVQVNSRFKIHPFWFLLKLLSDSRIQFISQDELAKIIITEADNENDKTYEKIVGRIIEYRNHGDKCLSPDFFSTYKPGKGEVNPDHPFSHLEDTANTMMNWLEYTQLIYREDRKMYILPEMKDTVDKIISSPLKFIPNPEEHENFQRKYGLDSKHLKDTRNLNAAQTVTPFMLAEIRIKQEYSDLALRELITGVDNKLIEKLAEKTGYTAKVVEEVLHKNYPRGASSAFMPNYFEMAFKGREECRDFEMATAEIFDKVFGFESKHIAGGAREVPDVYVVSKDNFQAIIDTKAYSQYGLSAQHRDRMIYHYLPDISSYTNSDLPVGFFSYIAGGFTPTIANPLKKIVEATGVNGSAMPVSNFIKMIEKHNSCPYQHDDIKRIFAVNRKVELLDL